MGAPRRQTNGTLRSDMWRPCDIPRRQNNVAGAMQYAGRLAMPVILAGVCVAALSSIAIATVAAFFNAGGLGALIREGISPTTATRSSPA